MCMHICVYECMHIYLYTHISYGVYRFDGKGSEARDATSLLWAGNLPLYIYIYIYLHVLAFPELPSYIWQAHS